MQTSLARAYPRVVPIVIVVVLGIGWALPLGWPASIAFAAALATLVVAVMRAPIDKTSALAAGCLASVGLISLGYAAYALTHTDAFGPVTRLGYPLLVATGLRVPGGVCVLLLCGLASAVPVLFGDEAISGRS